MILEPRWKSYIITTGKPVLTTQQCDDLIRIGQSEPNIEATIRGKSSEQSPKLDHSHRKSNISWIPFTKAVPIYQVIRRWMEITNNNYFGFDAAYLPMFSERGQYAEYNKGDFYNWHMDSNIEMEAMPAVRKISMTLLLNDPEDFEGGDLEIFSGETLDSKKNKYKLKRGYAVFFASFLLHRVIPVIKGNRKSLVMWFGGTPLR